MDSASQKKTYQPGYYGKKRQAASAWVDSHIRKWDLERSASTVFEPKPGIFPTVCFSRQIGVGALEVADLLAEMIHYRVIDREILEHMAKDANLSAKAVAFFDERYPGRGSELFSMLISEKTFIQSDYARQLVKTVCALAGSEPTIFVGRGTHLILPRKQVLSVQFVCSREFRAERLASLMNISRAEAERQIEICDAEQHEFFRKVYGKKESHPDEFDLVLHMDHIKGAFHAARIIACAFEQKFGTD